MRKVFYLSLTLFVLLILIVLFRNSSDSLESNTIRIGYNAESLYHGPIILANEMGIFEKNGLEVEMIPIKSAKETQQALSVGAIDVGSAGATNFFISISKGAPVKIIAPLASSPTQIFVRPNELKSIKELSGKTIASQRGGASNLALGYALKNENVSLDSVEFVDIEKSVRPIALMNKKIVDAVAAGEYEEKIYSDHGAVLLEEWKTLGYTNKSFPRTVIAVNTDFIASNKESVGIFIDSVIESQNFINDHPDEAALIISKHMKDNSEGIIDFSLEDILESWKTLHYVIWYDSQELLKLSTLAYDIGDLDSLLSIEQIFDNSFKDKLMEGQNEVYAP